VRTDIVPRQAGVIGLAGRPRMPAALRLPVPLETEERGPQGAPGPTFTGFGSIDYSDLDAGTPLTLPISTWTRIARRAAPSPANFAPLAPPWVGFTFWDGTLLHAHAIGDVYLFKFTFAVTPFQRNSGLRFAVRPGDDPAFDFGPEPIVLSVDAGTSQTGSETFSEQVRTRFAQSGATLYVMSTTGAILTEFSPEITPLSHT
jgi:hypothetical protein